MISSRSFCLFLAAIAFGLTTSAQAQPKRKATPTVVQSPEVVATPASALAAVEAPATDERAEEKWSGAVTHSGLIWDAFIDLEARLPNNDTLVNRGATVNDASLALSKEFGRTAIAMIDLPFRSDYVAGSNNFAFAADFAQAYVEIQRWAPLAVRLGQYESFFGVERNSSRDRYFANMGTIKTYLLPKTHTGALVEYKAQNVTLKGQLADPNGAGNMNGVAPTANPSPEIGGQVRVDSGTGYGALGLSYNDGKSAGTASNVANLLADLKGGIVANNLHGDLELTVRKTAGIDKSAFGIGVYAYRPIDEMWSLGGRIEYLKDSPNPASTTNPTADSVLSLAVGPSYKWTQEFLLRGDAFVMNLKQANVSDQTTFGLSISLVVEL